MSTDITVDELKINKLTKAQYDTAVQTGVISDNEISIITDLLDIQVDTMPTAAAKYADNIVQFTGTTDATYTNGYFYKCVGTGSPVTYSWVRTDVQPAGSILPSQAGNEGKFLKTDGTDASWAKIDIDNTNISNCIAEIPQDITLTLSGGTLTLKSSSKVYIPNGEGVFDVVNITTDKTTSYSSNGVRFVYVSSTGTFSVGSAKSEICSGSTDALVGTPWHTWFDTTNNVIRRYGSDGTTPAGYTCSLPIAIVTVSDGAISSIDRVFNGIGYIGHHTFLTPGVKGLIPNGFNDDGTLKNITCTISSVRIQEMATNKTSAGTYRTLNLVDVNTAYSGSYTEVENYEDMDTSTIVPTYVRSLNKTFNPSTGAQEKLTPIVTFLYTTANGVEKFDVKTTFHAVDYNDLKNIDTLPSQSGNNGKFLTTNGSAAFWANIPIEIPSQSGQSGKFLTTDGSSVSWATVSGGSLPSQTGNAGKVLTTDGTDASWGGDITAGLSFAKYNSGTNAATVISKVHDTNNKITWYQYISNYGYPSSSPLFGIQLGGNWVYLGQKAFFTTQNDYKLGLSGYPMATTYTKKISYSTKDLDVPDIEGTVSAQCSTLPVLLVPDGIVVQYIGTTDANYTNGYFYKATNTTIPDSYTSVSQTTGSSLSNVTVTIATFADHIRNWTDATSPTDIVLTYNSSYNNWNWNNHGAGASTWGLSFTGTPSNGDKITVFGFVEEHTEAAWTQVNVQPGGGGSLPSQTGNAGKFLTTDGTDPSWGNAVALNSNGKLDGYIATDTALNSGANGLKFHDSSNGADYYLRGNMNYGIEVNNWNFQNYFGQFIYNKTSTSASPYGEIGKVGNPLLRVTTTKISNGSDITVPNKAGTLSLETTSLPTAASTNVGQIYQYTGTTDANYTNGYFYKCVNNSGTYSWTQLDVQPSSGGGSSTLADLTDTTITSPSNNQVLTYDNTTSKWVNETRYAFVIVDHTA